MAIPVKMGLAFQASVICNIKDTRDDTGNNTRQNQKYDECFEKHDGSIS